MADAAQWASRQLMDPPAVFFLSLIVAAVVLGHAAGRARTGIAVAVAVLTTFTACSVLVALDYAGTWPSAPSGLLEWGRDLRGHDLARFDRGDWWPPAARLTFAPPRWRGCQRGTR
jgi:hypothetical protein